MKDRVKIYPDNIKGILAATLFIKVTNCFQAIVLLSKKGLGIECAILTRALLEVTFPLKAIVESENFVEEFILTENWKRFKLMNVILNDKKSFSTIHSQISVEQKKELEEEIERNGYKDMSTEEIARRANMQTFYQTAYRNLSEDVHTTVRSLEAYVVTDEQGNITMFENGPQIFELKKHKTAIMCLLIAMDSLNDIFELKLDNNIKQFEEFILNGS
ncbi:DUF5677 domain-containing protein [Paenibacillus sp. yr247]|uniref:DUF5677 domain-containing protein n=1 Tax=Paenibacillus sp. yr247 TaxID=1761880 RepID=UPI001587303F|nr:DUF5677 domain-containing protein [Paenibacillus sp. yr247]